MLFFLFNLDGFRSMLIWILKNRHLTYIIISCAIQCNRTHSVFTNKITCCFCLCKKSLWHESKNMDRDISIYVTTRPQIILSFH